MSAPARLAEPGERFVIFGHPEPEANGCTGTARQTVPADAERLLETRGGYPGPYMRVEVDGHPAPPVPPSIALVLKLIGHAWAIEPHWVIPRRWLWVLDGGGEEALDAEEDVEADSDVEVAA